MEDERRPLDYGTPGPSRRRSRVAAAILAYLFSSYAAGIAVVIASAVREPYEWSGAEVLMLAILSPVLPVIAGLRGAPGLIDAGWAGAFIALFVLAYQHFRKSATT